MKLRARVVFPAVFL